MLSEAVKMTDFNIVMRDIEGERKRYGASLHARVDRDESSGFCYWLLREAKYRARQYVRKNLFAPGHDSRQVFLVGVSGGQDGLVVAFRA